MQMNSSSIIIIPMEKSVKKVFHLDIPEKLNLIWIENMINSPENIHLKSKITEMKAFDLKTYTDCDEAINFISLNPSEKFLILSCEDLAELFSSVIGILPSVFICMVYSNELDGKCTFKKNDPKIKIFSDRDLLLRELMTQGALMYNQPQEEDNENPILPKNIQGFDDHEEEKVQKDLNSQMDLDLDFGSCNSLEQSAEILKKIAQVEKDSQGILEKKPKLELHKICNSDKIHPLADSFKLYLPSKVKKELRIKDFHLVTNDRPQIQPEILNKIYKLETTKHFLQNIAPDSQDKKVLNLIFDNQETVLRNIWDFITREKPWSELNKLCQDKKYGKILPIFNSALQDLETQPELVVFGQTLFRAFNLSEVNLSYYHKGSNGYWLNFSRTFLDSNSALDSVKGDEIVLFTIKLSNKRIHPNFKNFITFNNKQEVILFPWLSFKVTGQEKKDGITNITLVQDEDQSILKFIAKNNMEGKSDDSLVLMLKKISEQSLEEKYVKILSEKLTRYA